jgi:acetyl-CoA carboxylase biotin carboxylase subunit
MVMIRKVLIANRGEIAVRVIRACRELGIRSVGVYSTADRLAPHVLHADEAYPIGEAAAAQSYLRADTLVEVARRTGCDAVHPGYGFLSERAFFAAAVEAAGLRFVGPPAAAIAAMGDKTEARRRMLAAGVPVVPGTSEPAGDVAAALAAAADVGYPVLLKAAAGGGGKGMRAVRGPDEMHRAFEAAGHEARSAFGDGSLYVERYLDHPRHIEVQVLADAHGTVLHLGERECSIQRRHQKMIEESPSPVMTPELRRQMGEAAVAAARAVGYRNAGTIEFLFQDGAFYFLEMNTRIQVEHPVTELVTGIDLVQWQLRIAGGEALPFAQADIRLAGHAIECRITSEDASAGFLPSTGRVERLDVPAGPGVRWDGGVGEGTEVSLYYDPLLAKLVAHGPDRATAIARMSRALAELRIIGIETSAPFHARVMREPDFCAGAFDIRYIDRHPDLLEHDADPVRERLAALAAALLAERSRSRKVVRRAENGAGRAAGWRESGWRE